jgi:amino acid adenylation domain-containing protein
VNPYLLHHLLVEAAKMHPDREAVRCGNESLSYSQLYEKSLLMAETICAQGNGRGDKVGLMINKSTDCIVALYGILISGAAYVPIDPHLPVARIQYILDNCAIKILVISKETGRKLLSKLEGNSRLQTVIHSGAADSTMENLPAGLNLIKWPESRRLRIPDLGQEDLPDAYPAYILHTSGSTGSPKGVIISHLNSLTFIKSALEYFGISHGDRLACHAPLHFDLSVFDIFVAAAAGATLVLVPESVTLFPVKLVDFIKSEEITVWNSVSSVLTVIADQLERLETDLPHLRLVIFSGEVMPQKYLLSLRSRMQNASLYNIYGQTEANSSTGYLIEKIPDDPQWKIPVGKALPNFEVFLLNADDDEILDPHIQGEIHVKSSTVACGYLNMPELTGERFIPDPRHPQPASTVYRTGDMGFYDQMGDLVFVGRLDSMVKVRGHRVELDEIERTVSSHESVKLAVVVAVPDEKWTNRIVSFLSWKDHGEEARTELKAHCERNLPRYMVPEYFLTVESWPLTPNDKVDRKALFEKAVVAIEHG